MMINAVGLHKSYGGLKVLQNVDIQIETNEIVTILGKSGAGKSTLLHILGTLDMPDSGTLHIDGVDIMSKPEKEISLFRNQRIGFVFQFHHLLEEFTAVENVCIPAYIKKTNPKEAMVKAVELLIYLGLGERLDHKPSQLSGGEQQRVAIARALINQPAIVFADEPTGNLDAQTSSELHQLFLKLKKDFGQTFVIVTHNSELAALSDRRYYMESGKLIGQD